MGSWIGHCAVAAFVSAALSTSCSLESSSRQSAIPNGKYEVTGPVCRQSGESPNYSEARYKAVLYDFTPQARQIFALAGNLITQTIHSEECTVTITRAISINEGDRFVLTEFRQHQFSPENCQLQLSFDDGLLPYGVQSDLFQNTSSHNLDLLFTVEKISADQFELRSPPDDSPSEIWQTYGCGNLDQMVFKWQVVAEES